MRKGAPSVNPHGRPPKEARTDAAEPIAQPRRQVRQDGFINPYSGHGTSRDRRRYTTHHTIHVNDLAAIDLRRGNWLAKRICEALDDDAFRRAYTFELTDKKQTDALRRRLRKLGVNAKVKAAGQLERTCGGAALFPVIDGALGALDEPLDLESGPRIVKLHAIHVLEPRELQPVDWYTDLSHPKFGMPMTYRLWPLGNAGRGSLPQAVIHESRLAIYPGDKITREPLPGQRLGWSDSSLNSTAEVIFDYGLDWGSISTILQNFSQRVVKYAGLMKMLEKRGGEALVEARMRVQDMAANVLQSIALDADDDLVQVAMSIAGLSDLMVQRAQVVSAAADMPMTRLYGTAPRGLNATGEYDDNSWDDRVHNRQDDHTDALEWLIQLELLSLEGPTAGKMPDDFGLEWRPLSNPSEKEDAETRKLTAETDAIYFDMGAPGPDILKSRYGGKAYSRETTLDFKAIEAQAKIDAERAQDLDDATLNAVGDPAGNARRGVLPPPKDPNAEPNEGQ